MKKILVSLGLAGAATLAAAQSVKARFAGAGAEVHSQGLGEFAAFVKGDNEKWAKLVKERKLQLD